MDEINGYKMDEELSLLDDLDISELTDADLSINSVPIESYKDLSYNCKYVRIMFKRAVKLPNKPLTTTNNGFKRKLRPEGIITSIIDEDQIVFVVKFQQRKIPELITLEEMKLRAPDIVKEYFLSNASMTFADDEDELQSVNSFASM
ncbi:uncharacterized protein LOC117134804 [Drosophila busckii]|uniref:uncharacterized protein LOC117134804 n=1 Tax=Drosophila busckii TaxID=30019 RepID=UPI0014332FF2|nr:uncharacterized protein LOC117134804 [Drosophila busckii]